MNSFIWTTDRQYFVFFTFLSVALSFSSALQQARRSWRARLIVPHRMYTLEGQDVDKSYSSALCLHYYYLVDSVDFYYSTHTLFTASLLMQTTLATRHWQIKLLTSFTNVHSNTCAVHWPQMTAAIAVTELSHAQVQMLAEVRHTATVPAITTLPSCRATRTHAHVTHA